MTKILYERFFSYDNCGLKFKFVILISDLDAVCLDIVETVDKLTVRLL